MKYVPLGPTGMMVSQLCLGTMTFGREASPDESKRIFDRCRDAGINFLDTANIYSNGGAEELLGPWLAECRDEWIVATKAGYAMGDAPNQRGTSRRHLRLELEASLRRLRTEWVDIFYIHGFDPHTGLDETMRALDDFVREGKVHCIGVSNFAAWQMMKAQGIAQGQGGTPFHVVQPMYSLVKRQVEVEILPMAQSEGLAVVPYSPLGAGLLTGKYTRDKHDAHVARLRESDQYAKRYQHDWYFDTATQFAALAEELSVAPAPLAIAWVGAHPAVTAPILGARTVTQVEQCLEAVAIDITPELYERIARLSPTPPPATDRLEEQSS